MPTGIALAVLSEIKGLIPHLFYMRKGAFSHTENGKYGKQRKNREYIGDFGGSVR